MEVECHHHTTANEIMAPGCEHQQQMNTKSEPVSLNEGGSSLPQIKPTSNQAVRYNCQLKGNTKKGGPEKPHEDVCIRIL